MTPVVVAVLYRPNDNRFYIQQRKLDNPHSPGKWECPGGKIEDGETPQAALKRELTEELGLREYAFVNELWLGNQKALHEHGQYMLVFFLCQLHTPDAISPTSANAWAWVNFEEATKRDMLPGDLAALHAGHLELLGRR